MATPDMNGWRPIETAPTDGTSIILDLGETIPNVADVRVGQWISEYEANELGEELSAAGGWIIWNTGSDWFVIPFGDAFGWFPLPKPPVGA